MTATPTLRVHRFHPEELDPITVYVEEYGQGRARITVQCYGRAWTAYWGSHGEQSVEHFVAGCHTGYIADNLEYGLSGLFLKRFEVHQRSYLERIAAAIKNHFMQYREHITKNN